MKTAGIVFSIDRDEFLKLVVNSSNQVVTTHDALNTHILSIHHTNTSCQHIITTDPRNTPYPPTHPLTPTTLPHPPPLNHPTHTHPSGLCCGIYAERPNPLHHPIYSHPTNPTHPSHPPTRPLLRHLCRTVTGVITGPTPSISLVGAAATINHYHPVPYPTLYPLP